MNLLNYVYTFLLTKSINLYALNEETIQNGVQVLAAQIFKWIGLAGTIILIVVGSWRLAIWFFNIENVRPRNQAIGAFSGAIVCGVLWVALGAVFGFGS